MFSFQMLILMANGFMNLTAQFFFVYCGRVDQVAYFGFFQRQYKIFNFSPETEHSDPIPISRESLDFYHFHRVHGVQMCLHHIY